VNDISLKNLKFIAVLRCSEEDQIETSIPQQRRACEDFAKEQGFKILRFEELGGYSATLGQQVEPLLSIIRRKLAGEQFDGILFDSYNRFIRSDVDGAKLYAEASDFELLLVTVKDGLMMGEGAWVKRGAATDQSVGYTKDLSRNLNRAIADLIENKKIPPTLCFVWGIDRLYYDQNGRKEFRVRKLADGRKEVMDPDPPFSHRYFIPKEARRLHLRQHNWKYVFVPGDPEITGIIAHIWKLKYIDGWPDSRITAHLNGRHIPSPRKGGRWSISTVKTVLNNPVYLGFSVGSVQSNGSHTERRSGSPKVHPIPRRPGYRKDGKGKRTSISPRFRPPDEWEIKQQDDLLAFLPSDLREAASLEWERKKSEGWNKPKRNKSNTEKRKYPPLSYFLTNMLKIKSDGCRMTGTTGGGRGPKEIRYYHTPRSNGRPVEGGPAERCRADIIEAEVKRALEIVLSDEHVCGTLIPRAVKKKYKERQEALRHAAPLHREKRELEDRYKRIAVRADSDRAKELMAAEMNRILNRLNEIDVLLGTSVPTNSSLNDIDETVKSLQSKLKNLRPLLDEASFTTMRQLAEAFVSQLTFDPVKREFEIEFSLPAWTFEKAESLTRPIGSIEDLGHQFSNQTNVRNRAVLLQMRCKEHRKHRFSRSSLQSSVVLTP